MATDIAALGIKVDASDVKEAVKGLKQLEKQAKGNEKQNKNLTNSFGLLKGAVGAFISSLAIRELFTTAGAFESMRMSLETVTGSADKASMAMKGITEFAKNTPFQVSELTNAFIKLKALGIEPTEENLRSFGNTSSAMGKSLNQMIEAVADAATGEFERLKEFGIKARSEGENVSFTFQGITTTVKKNSEEITKYLQKIGDEKFGGAMAKQMGTLNGKISNLGDAWDDLLVTFGDSGALDIAKGAIEILISSVNKLKDGIKGAEDIGKSLFAFLNEQPKTVRQLNNEIKDMEDRLSYFQGLKEKAAGDDAGFLSKFWRGSKSDYQEKIDDIQNTISNLKEMKRQSESFYGKEDSGEGSITKAGAGTSGMTAAEKAFEAETERLMLEQDMMDERLDRESDFNDKMLAVKQDYWDRLYNLESGSQQAALDFSFAVRMNDYKGALKHGSLMLSNAAKTNKEAFELQKAMALANAAVTLPSAVLKSFENGGGYPWGLIPAGLMLAQGLQQISAINSTSFGGKPSAAGISGGGGSTSPSAPVASGLPSGATATPLGTEKARTEVSISLNGVGYSKDAVRELIEQINIEIGDGANLVTA